MRLVLHMHTAPSLTGRLGVGATTGAGEHGGASQTVAQHPVLQLQPIAGVGDQRGQKCNHVCNLGGGMREHVRT